MRQPARFAAFVPRLQSSIHSSAGLAEGVLYMISLITTSWPEAGRQSKSVRTTSGVKTNFIALCDAEITNHKDEDAMVLIQGRYCKFLPGNSRVYGASCGTRARPRGHGAAS